MWPFLKMRKGLAKHTNEGLKGKESAMPTTIFCTRPFL